MAAVCTFEAACLIETRQHHSSAVFASVYSQLHIAVKCAEKQTDSTLFSFSLKRRNIHHQWREKSNERWRRDSNSEEFPDLRLEYTSRDKDRECWELRYVDFFSIPAFFGFFPFLFLNFPAKEAWAAVTRHTSNWLYTVFVWTSCLQGPVNLNRNELTATTEWKNRL